MTSPAPLDVGALTDQAAATAVPPFAETEQAVFAAVAEVMRRTDTVGPELYGQLAAIANRAARRLQAQVGPLSARLIAVSAAQGRASAVDALAGTVAQVAGIGGVPDAQTGLVKDLAARLDRAARQVRFVADDVYRVAVQAAATALVDGRRGLTPAAAQSAAWRDLVRQGVRGFTDSAGRRWSLTAYVEMAVRTVSMEAYNQARLDRFTAAGLGLFTVSHDGRPCPLCLPWEGAVLSNDLPAGPHEAPSALTGRPVQVDVRATVAQAKALGLWHPNCKHVLGAYLPGVTRVHSARRWTAEDQARYAATQQLRALERRVRAEKRQQLAALDDLAAMRARRAVRAAQAEIRAHIAEHQLVRRPRREQLDLGNR